MNPTKILSEEEWAVLKKNFKHLNVDSWKYLDGLKKLSLLKHSEVDLSKYNILTDNLSPKYPADIYLIENKTRYTLPDRLKCELKGYVNDDREVGGTIKYNKMITYQILFNGDINRIKLDLGKDTDSLFHTHPDEKRRYEPPSVLDVVNYLLSTVRYISTIILDLSYNVEHPDDDPLEVQNHIIFAKEGIYIIYISYPLLKKIVKRLIEAYNVEGDYIYNVEKALEELEMGYLNDLFKYNKYYEEDLDLEEYIRYLNKLGIIVKLFSYNSDVESYILI